MNLGPLRSLVLSLNQATHGVTATVTRSGHAAVSTRAIWLTAPIDDPQPYGHDYSARGPRKAMVLSRADFPDGVERGTVISAPEAQGGTLLSWTVDSIERTEADHWRVVVVRS